MKLLDKLILKEWLSAFFLSFGVLFFVIFLADFVAEYLRSKTIFYILQNFVIKLPEFLAKLLPSCCLLAGLFSFSKLKDRNELVAIFAGGMLPVKIFKIVSTVALIIAGLQIINLGYFAPWGKKKQQARLENAAGMTKVSFSGERIWYKGKGYFVSFVGQDMGQNTIMGPQVFYFSPDNLLETFWSASSAKYEPESQKWVLEKARTHHQLDQKVPSLAQTKQKAFITLQENPKDLQKIEIGISQLFLPELFYFLNRQKKVGIEITTHWMAFWNIFALAWLCPLFAFIPLFQIFSPNRRQSSFGKNISFTLVFSLVFWLAHESIAAKASAGVLSPFFGTHLSAFILSALLIVLWMRHARS